MTPMTYRYITHTPKENPGYKSTDSDGLIGLQVTHPHCSVVKALHCKSS